MARSIERVGSAVVYLIVLIDAEYRIALPFRYNSNPLKHKFNAFLELV